MKKAQLVLLALALCTTSFPQETRGKSSSRKGEGAGYASRDASALSMMGWGIALAVGIATLFSLLDNNATPHSGGGQCH